MHKERREKCSALLGETGNNRRGKGNKQRLRIFLRRLKRRNGLGQAAPCAELTTDGKQSNRVAAEEAGQKENYVER